MSLVLEEQFPIIPDFENCMKIALFGKNKEGIFYTMKDLRHIGGVIGKYRDKYIFYSNPNSVDNIKEI